MYRCWVATVVNLVPFDGAIRLSIVGLQIDTCEEGSAKKVCIVRFESRWRQSMFSPKISFKVPLDLVVELVYLKSVRTVMY